MTYDISDFARFCRFPEEAESALLAGEAALRRTGRAASVLEACREMLFSETGTPWPLLDGLAAEAGLHRYLVHQLFLIFCAGETHARYRAAGLSDGLYRDAMRDLKYKMEETWQVYGVWGVYCGPWLSSLLQMKCFCLGRLQFELRPSPFSLELAGYALRPGEPVVNIHIPSFGKLAYADVVDAYGRAASFFGDRFPGGAVWFHCKTWILYPPVNRLLPDGNLKRFSGDFQVVHASCVDPLQDDRYRVFHLPADTPMEDYPETNTLQRNLKAWLLAGNTMGIGSGLFLWKDGEVVSHG